MRDQKPGPSLEQLDGPVDTPRVDRGNAKDRRGDQRPHCPTNGDFGVADAPQEVAEAEEEYRDAGQLKDDARNHDVCARLGVAVDLPRGHRGETAADGLDDEGKNVAGAEDPEVPLGGEEG